MALGAPGREWLIKEFSFYWPIDFSRLMDFQL